MTLVKRMLEDLQKYPQGTQVKYLHNQFQDNERFVFILGEYKYTLEKVGPNCFIKINQNIQNISLDVYLEACQIFQTDNRLKC